MIFYLQAIYHIYSRATLWQLFFRYNIETNSYILSMNDDFLFPGNTVATARGQLLQPE
jgi:hypothetical protein